MPGIIEAITEVAKAGGAVANEIENRDKEKNTAAMVTAKESQLEQTQKDAVNATIATGDLATERKDDAE